MFDKIIINFLSLPIDSICHIAPQSVIRQTLEVNLNQLVMRRRLTSSM